MVIMNTRVNIRDCCRDLPFACDTMTVVIEDRFGQSKERSISSVARWKKNGRYIGYRENIRERVNTTKVLFPWRKPCVRFRGT